MCCYLDSLLHQQIHLCICAHQSWVSGKRNSKYLFPFCVNCNIGSLALQLGSLRVTSAGCYGSVYISEKFQKNWEKGEIGKISSKLIFQRVRAGSRADVCFAVEANQSCTDVVAISSLDALLLSIFSVTVIQQWWLLVGLLLGVWE